MPTSDAAQEAWGLFWRIFSEDKPRRSQILAELEITPMQAQALQGLEPGVPLPMSALAGALYCDPSNVTGVADRLESAGLVERRPAAHDRRVKALLLTDEGERARERIRTSMSVPPPALAALPDEDAQALCAILRRAVEAEAATTPR